MMKKLFALLSLLTIAACSIGLRPAFTLPGPAKDVALQTSNAHRNFNKLLKQNFSTQKIVITTTPSSQTLMIHVDSTHFETERREITTHSSVRLLDRTFTLKYRTTLSGRVSATKTLSATKAYIVPDEQDDIDSNRMSTLNQALQQEVIDRLFQRLGQTDLQVSDA